MLYDYDFEIPRTRLFSRESLFKRFVDITEERREEIRLQAETFLKNISAESPSEVQKYLRTIQFLASSRVHVTLPTFDERILFFILACDPELKFLNIYFDRHIIPLRRIEKATKKEKAILEKKRNDQLSAYVHDIRETMGFYDSKLLKYESIYYEEVARLDLLISNVAKDVATSYLAFSEYVLNFDNITDEEFEQIKEISESYKKQVDDPENIQTLIYNIYTKRKLVNLSSLKAKLVLIIYTIDPELKMLRIYEEESTFDEIKRRCIEEFGYFNKELLRLETLYHNRFCPEKTISDWSDEKRLLWTQD